MYYNTWRKLITTRKNSETCCEINLKKYLDFRWILAMIFSSKWIVCESCSETNWKKIFGWKVNHVSNSYGSFNIETHVNICYHVHCPVNKLGQTFFLAPIEMTIFITFCWRQNFFYHKDSEVNIFVPDLYFTIQNQILLDIVSRSKNWLKFGYTVQYTYALLS